ncbi:hypothetical protein ACLBUN_34265, partial [Pseudomonas aeruginosa]
RCGPVVRLLQRAVLLEVGDNQALLQFDVGMASAGGLIAVLIANIAAIVLVRMIGKNLTERS